MKRYLNWLDKLNRPWRSLERRLGVTQDTDSILTDDRAGCDRLYWTDLHADPDECHPRRWSRRTTATVLDLHAALEELY